ncbi:hypothetical protein OAC50_00620 [bacterium]|nr:hypothetical protein [bacterium]
MKKIIFTLIIIPFLFSCEKERFYPPACPGGCEANYTLLYKLDTILPNVDGFFEIEYDGLNYFQIKGELSDLDIEYEVNGVPLVEANFDTDYWILIDSIRFTTPQYSYLGWFNDNNFNNPITVGNYTYTMVDLAENHTPLNIAGYQIPKHFCFECPYAPTLVGTHSKYNYKPTQNILLDNEMVGDTISLFVETRFNTDLGQREEFNNEYKIIIK